MRRWIQRLAYDVYESCGTPRALSCKILLRSGEWDQLATLQVDPSGYLDAPSGADKFRRDYQAISFLRKFDGLPTTWDKDEVALRSFREAELQCHCTNNRLSHLRLFGPQDPTGARYWDLLERAKNWIRRLLGPIRDLSHDELRFGPGTAVEFRNTRLKPCLRTKLWIEPAVTPQALLFWHRATEGSPLYTRRRRLGLPCHKLVDGNVFTTVPKDSKTSRGICIEPGGNLQLQLAIGARLKGLLYRTGIDVRRRDGADGDNPAVWKARRYEILAKDRHGDLARQGSIDGRTATLDLSMASDTVDRKSVV